MMFAPKSDPEVYKNLEDADFAVEEASYRPGEPESPENQAYTY